jgi:hypothetical protein
VHASREKPVHTSQLFIGRDIRSEKVSIFTFFFTILFPSCNQGVDVVGTVQWNCPKEETQKNEKNSELWLSSENINDYFFLIVKHTGTQLVKACALFLKLPLLYGNYEGLRIVGGDTAKANLKSSFWM